MRWAGLAGCATVLGVLLSLGCSGGGGGGGVGPLSTTDQEIAVLAAMNGVNGDPVRGRPLPVIQSPLAQLGMRLFFSKSLGADRDSACVTCHHPLLGGGDDLSLSIGVGATDPDLLGPGRLHDAGSPGFDGGPTVPRNAPTTFNMALWRRVLFHDGRIEGLGPPAGPGGARPIRTPDTPFGVPDPLAGDNLTMAQARFPVTDETEMKGFLHGGFNGQGIRDYLASRFGGYGLGAGDLADTGYWLQQFRTGFQDPTGTATSLITEQNIARALAAYVNSQVLVQTPWRRYLEGNLTAISEQAKEGALLFYRPVGGGGAGCASCHAGDFFTDERFHNLAMPQIGRGKGDGGGDDDFGRFRETGNPADMYAFRTPTLLNVSVTGPFSHSGAYATLEGVVRHHLDPVVAMDGYDTAQLTQPGIQNLGTIQIRGRAALTRLLQDRIAGRPVIQDVSLSDDQVNALLAFLETLTDPCTRDPACMEQWIPDPVSGADPNGDQLDARFAGS